MMRALIGGLLAAALAWPAVAEIASSVDPSTLGKRKSTELGLYVTSPDAMKALEADPTIVLLDVRTRAEFEFVGHPEPTDANIPYQFHDAATFKGSRYGMKPNPDFVARVDALIAKQGLTKASPIFIICRSGGRSARSVNVLAKAGYTNVYNVVDGFEGGKDKATGHRTKEGWRFENLPWTYKVREDQAYGS